MCEDGVFDGFTDAIKKELKQILYPANDDQKDQESDDLPSCPKRHFTENDVPQFSKDKHRLKPFDELESQLVITEEDENEVDSVSMASLSDDNLSGEAKINLKVEEDGGDEKGFIRLTGDIFSPWK